MYPDQAKSSESVIRLSELPAISSSFMDMNERTNKIICEISEKLDRIYPYNEPSPKNPNEITNGPQMPSIVTDLRNQLLIANQNADMLSGILRQLNMIV
jgi:hypothetical protein